MERRLIEVRGQVEQRLVGCQVNGAVHGPRPTMVPVPIPVLHGIGYRIRNPIQTPVSRYNPSLRRAAWSDEWRAEWLAECSWLRLRGVTEAPMLAWQADRCSRRPRFQEAEREGNATSNMYPFFGVSLRCRLAAASQREGTSGWSTYVCTFPRFLTLADCILIQETMRKEQVANGL